MSAGAEAEFQALLEFLQQARGFDFSGYKRPSLTRRFQRRMQALGIERFEDYRDYLEVHQDEFPHLFNTILINVTSFFRDPLAWEYVAKEVIPRILDAKAPHDQVRVWSAGCASGEEAYTLAILLAEAMVDAGIGEGLPPEAARTLALQTVLGAARMLTESDVEAAELRRRVTSPNGTTQAALETFEAGGFRALVAAAIHAARVRGAELSAAND